jgi:hypothetical protein
MSTGNRMQITFIKNKMKKKPHIYFIIAVLAISAVPADASEFENIQNDQQLRDQYNSLHSHITRSRRVLNTIAKKRISEGLDFQALRHATNNWQNM